MDNPLEKSSVPSLLSAFWRPSGVIYLACMLAAMAVGLWPEVVDPSPSPSSPLPVLRTLAAGQAVFIFLIWPLVALWRSQREAADVARTPRPRVSRATGPHEAEAQEEASCGRGVRDTRGQGAHATQDALATLLPAVIETSAYLLLASPLYVLAAYLADATATDALRSVLQTMLLWPAVWALGYLMAHRPAARATAMIGALAAILAFPAGVYILREFLPVFNGPWLWHLSPVTFAWQTAASRVDTLWPTPTWATLVWPALAAVTMLVSLMTNRSRKRQAFDT